MFMLALRLRRVRRQWQHFFNSIWFFPVLMAIGALGLFWGTTLLDMQQGAKLDGTGPWWFNLLFFTGDAEAAQSLLSTIAGLWATVVGISFSVTLVTVQLTATKYIAQVLPLFERDKVNQLVLGTYLSTVIYALLVLRTVRVEEPRFVPFIGVNVAMLLAVFALFMLIAFITNIISFVRPSHFLSRTKQDTLKAIAAGLGPESRGWIEPRPEIVPPRPAKDAAPIRSPRSGIVTAIDWDALCISVQKDLTYFPGEGRCWRLYLHVRVGDPVEAGEPLAHLVTPEGASVDGMGAWVRTAVEIGKRRFIAEDAQSGLEALAGLTIKGAVQGDLDVTFEGVDSLFALIQPLASQPAPAETLRVESGGNELLIHRPSMDLLAKIMRELTLISEVALAPSLPFRPVTEGISARLRQVLVALTRDEEWEGFHRVLKHSESWYMSAFYHMDWVNGMRNLANDLAELAIHARHCEHPGAFESVLAMIMDVRDRLDGNEAAHEAIREALAHVAREIELPLLPVSLLLESDQPTPDDGSPASHHISD